MKKQPTGSDFLRLVSNNKDKISHSQKMDCDNHISRSRKSRGRQDIIFVLIIERELFGDTFCGFANKFRPDFILDLRRSPRLDLLAGSRVKAFEFFNELDVKYLDVSGRAGSDLIDEVWKNEDFLSDIINRCAMKSSQGRGVITIFLDDEDSLIECQAVLTSKKVGQHNGGLPKMDMKVSHYKSGLLAI